MALLSSLPTAAPAPNHHPSGARAAEPQGRSASWNRSRLLRIFSHRAGSTACSWSAECPGEPEDALEVRVTNRFIDDDLQAYNSLGDIRSTDLADQVVMLGAHLDTPGWRGGSWKHIK